MSETTGTPSSAGSLQGKKLAAPGSPATKDEAFYRAGQWQLVWWKFRRHKLAQMAMVVLAIFYLIAVFAEFVSPFDPLHRMKEYAAMPPVNIRLVDWQGNFRLPFVYDLVMKRDPVTLRPMYTEDPGQSTRSGCLSKAIRTRCGA